MQLLNAGDKGWGVFAGEDIQPDTLVCIYVGEVVDADEAARRRTIYSLKVGVRILGVEHVEWEGHSQRAFCPLRAFCSLKLPSLLRRESYRSLTATYSTLSMLL